MRAEKLILSPIEAGQFSSNPLVDAAIAFDLSPTASYPIPPFPRSEGRDEAIDRAAERVQTRADALLDAASLFTLSKAHTQLTDGTLYMSDTRAQLLLQGRGYRRIHQLKLAKSAEEQSTPRALRRVQAKADYVSPATDLEEATRVAAEDREIRKLGMHTRYDVSHIVGVLPDGSAIALTQQSIPGTRGHAVMAGAMRMPTGEVRTLPFWEVQDRYMRYQRAIERRNAFKFARPMGRAPLRAAA